MAYEKQNDRTEFFNCRCCWAASIDSSCFKLEAVDCGCKVSRSLVEGDDADGRVGG